MAVGAAVSSFRRPDAIVVRLVPTGRLMTAFADLPEYVIDATRGRPLRECVLELAHSHETLMAFVSRHIKIKYQQTALGVGWAVFQPLIATAILAVVLGRFAHLNSEHVAYVTFAMAGAVIWTFFSAALTFAMDSVVRDQHFLRKVYFPREILPISSVVAFMFDLIPAIAVFLVMALLTGTRFTWTLAFLPLPIALAVLFAAAVGMAASALTVFFRDMRLIVPFVIQIGILATPVAYSLDLVPGRWQELYALINPIGIAIDTIRRVVLHGIPPNWALFVPSSAITLVELVVVYWLFKRVDGAFVDRI